MRIALLLYVVVSIIVISGVNVLPASAGDVLGVREIRIGVLDHDSDNLWSGSQREDGVDINAELIFSPGLDVLYGTIRPNLGVSLNNQGDTSKVYAGGLWQYDCPKGLFFNLGLGIAAHNGDTDDRSGPDKKVLGSRFLFRVAAEVGFFLREHHSLSLMFDHVSNAYLAEPNEGMDTVGIRYGYRF